MDEEVVMAELAPDYQSRIAQAQAEIENIGPVSLFAKDAESQAKRARIMELNDNIKAWQNGYENSGDYSAAQEAKRANRKPYEAPEAKYQPRIGETTLDAAPAQEGYTRLYRGLENNFDPKYLPSVDDNPFGYESWTDNYNLAKQYGNNVYSVDVPTNRIADQIVTADGERVPVVKTTKKAGLNGVDGVEYMLNANDPLRQELEYRRIVGAPEQNAVAGAMLSPEQKEFFKDSVIRDENGNLMPLYHGSNSKFTVFDKSKGGQSNKTAKVGHWFTPNKEAAEKWAKQAWWGDKDPTVYETYLNIKKPMVYEAVDNSAQIKKLQAQLEQAWDNISSTYRGSKEYYDAYKEYNNIARQIDDLSFTDPYEQFRSDIYAMEGKTPSQANVGGVGMVMNDEDAAVQKYIDMLKGEGYDGIIIKGTGYDQNVMGGPNDQYVVFDSNQIKDVNNLTPTDNADIMAERAAPGQLGLFDQTTTKAPETGYSQLGLFDQPTQPVTPKTIDVADVNPYAPVNGEVTQTMRDRAAEIMMNYKNGLPENELYNRINPETMPTSGIDVIARQADGLKPKARKEYITRALFGNKNIEDATMDELFDVYYADNPQRRASMEAKIQQVRDANYYGPELKNTIIENTRKNFVKNVKTAINKASEATSSRNGFTGAADAVLSERLGIAPGNTNKRQLRHDSDKTTYGRYRPDAKEISITEKFPTPENAISTMAHERLHSFQHEADALGGRYAEDVKNAYKDLQKDLLPLLHGRSRIRKDHARNIDYYESRIEQESRMLQDYLDQKGYTDSKRIGRGEYGEEINPAFDKFFDKLRELSKKGVALPAILATLGLGGYATQNQEEDKDNGQQI
jgi:hypothetical protein